LPRLRGGIREGKRLLSMFMKMILERKIGLVLLIRKVRIWNLDVTMESSIIGSLCIFCGMNTENTKRIYGKAFFPPYLGNKIGSFCTSVCWLNWALVLA